MDQLLGPRDWCLFLLLRCESGRMLVWYSCELPRRRCSELLDWCCCLWRSSMGWHSLLYAREAERRRRVRLRTSLAGLPDRFCTNRCLVIDPPFSVAVSALRRKGYEINVRSGGGTYGVQVARLREERHLYARDRPQGIPLWTCQL